MVFYNNQALNDIENIFNGLLEWQTSNNQKIMEYNEVVRYRDDIRDTCNSLDKITYHARAKYPDHLKYGTYVYRYNRNKRTQWYIIYEKMENNIFICKIISNYKTISK
jgi:hypothetical protein